jgi:glucosamine-6-phosphate deaminase
MSKRELYNACRIPAAELEHHPELRIPFRICRDSIEMGVLMARELVQEIQARTSKGEPTRAILPCGPTCWHKPFVEIVNRERVSLRSLVVFLMDECLDWQGRPLPRRHPFNFRTVMEEEFYSPVRPELRVLEENRYSPDGGNMVELQERIRSTTIDITYGGWGQDGHVAFNQAKRNPYSPLSVEDVRMSTVRIQENNLDTILALAQRTLGCAYQFVPPMSVTLGLKEIMSSKKVRVFSDTGAWKQTALRVALFGPVTPEYPMSFLQEHPDVLITATLETATHPISDHPEWDMGV